MTPFAVMAVARKIVNGQAVAIGVTQPAHFPPPRYHGRTSVRVGPRRAIATAEEEPRLTERRRSRDVPCDIRPTAGAGIEDLDLLLFHRTDLPAAVAPEVLPDNGRSPAQQWASLRFLDAEGAPTTLGPLMVGREPTHSIPCAYASPPRALHPDGGDPGPARVGGTAPGRLSARLDVEGGSVDRRRPDHPLVALPQLARNAIFHRRHEGTNAPVRISWFSDRVEILSAGGPCGQVSRDNFGRGDITDYRNPHLAEAMKVLGHVRRFAVGLPLAQNALRENGNPPARWRSKIPASSPC